MNVTESKHCQMGDLSVTRLGYFKTGLGKQILLQKKPKFLLTFWLLLKITLFRYKNAVATFGQLLEKIDCFLFQLLVTLIVDDHFVHSSAYEKFKF